MISIYVNQYKNAIILDYLSYNLVAFLIHRPILGITDTPTNVELTARKNLTMALASSSEITTNGGYSRQIVNLSPITVDSNGISIVTATVNFTPNPSESFSPFTHICYARGVDLINTSPANGNNRGNPTGTLVKVEPVLQAPLQIQAPVSFIHTTDFKVSYT